MTIKTVLSILIFILVKNLFSQQASIVIVDSVISEKINQTVPIIGSLSSKRETKLMASVPGVIDKVFIDEGDIVKKGQLLARIDFNNYKLLFEIAKSNEAKALANFEIAKLKTLNNKLDLDRMTALKGSSAFNKSKFDNLKNIDLIFKSQELVAESELNVKKNQKDISNLNLKKSQVRALYDGIIEDKFIEAGEVVSIGEEMFQLISKNNLEVIAEVPSNRTFALSLEDKIKFTTTDGISLIGKIRAIGNKENTKTRTLKIFLDFNNEPKDIGRNLLSSESVNLSIPIAKGKNLLTIHKDAILKREGMSLAYVVKEDKVEIRPLKLGEAVGNRFVVINGVNLSEQVVIKGNERLRPGQKITIKDNKE